MRQECAISGSDGVNNVTVTASNPPTTGPYAGNGCAVTVATTAFELGLNEFLPIHRIGVRRKF